MCSWKKIVRCANRRRPEPATRVKSIVIIARHTESGTERAGLRIVGFSHDSRNGTRAQQHGTHNKIDTQLLLPLLSFINKTRRELGRYVDRRATLTAPRLPVSGFRPRSTAPPRTSQRARVWLCFLLTIYAVSARVRIVFSHPCAVTRRISYASTRRVVVMLFLQ